MEYTTHIPEEFFIQGISSVQVTITLVILILILFFVGYKIYKFVSIKKKPEYF